MQSTSIAIETEALRSLGRQLSIRYILYAPSEIGRTGIYSMVTLSLSESWDKVFPKVTYAADSKRN
jgi:hypothetical protein